MKTNNMKIVTKNKAYAPIRSTFKVEELDVYSAIEVITSRDLKELLRERDLPIQKLKDDMINTLGIWIECNCKTVNVEIV